MKRKKYQKRRLHYQDTYKEILSQFYIFFTKVTLHEKQDLSIAYIQSDYFENMVYW